MKLAHCAKKLIVPLLFLSFIGFVHAASPIPNRIPIKFTVHLWQRGVPLLKSPTVPEADVKLALLWKEVSGARNSFSVVLKTDGKGQCATELDPRGKSRLQGAWIIEKQLPRGRLLKEIKMGTFQYDDLRKVKGIVVDTFVAAVDDPTKPRAHVPAGGPQLMPGQSPEDLTLDASDPGYSK